MSSNIDFFQNLEILSEVALADIEFLNQNCTLITKKAGENILQIGEDLKEIYFIKKGVVQISILSINNTYELLPDVKAGEILGEMELWDNYPITSLYTAKTDVELLKVPKEDFKKFLEKVPLIRDKIFTGTIQKWRNLEILFHKNINLLAEAIQKNEIDEKILEEQREKIKEESRIKELFIENISHEFRTPLTVIRGLIESFDVSDKSKAVLDYDLYLKLQSSSSYLSDLINELLDFSQLTQRDINLNYQWVNASNEFKGILENFLLQAKRDKIKIKYFLPEPLLLFIDISRVRQILYHLVSNAIKFTEQGSVKINIYYRSMKRNSCILCISVKDTGVGISEEDLKLIFNKFVRLKNKYYSIRGTGIGLSLVKTLVDMMNGKISVKSELQVGSEFKVEIPVKFKNIAYFDLVSEEIDFSDKDKIIQVLLIDDYEDTHIIVKNLLKNYKFKVDSLFNSKSLLETIADKDYDVILLDIMLPEEDGYMILETLHDYYNKNVSKECIPKIIAFTALGSEEDLAKINASGFDGKLLKPFSKKELLKVLIPKQ